MQGSIISLIRDIRMSTVTQVHILVILHHLLPFQLIFIVSLSPLPIKRQLLIHFGSKLWIRNFLLCIRQILRIWFLYLLVRVLLVVVRCIRSRLILMGLLSDTKLGWLQKDTLNSMVWTMRRHLPRLKMTTIRTLIIVASIRQ